MINSDDFYSLVPGTIGYLEYIYKANIPTEDQIQIAANQISSNRFSSFLSNYAMLSGEAKMMTPQEAFERYRQEAKIEAENIAGQPSLLILYVQIGQAESVKKMEELEKDPRFVRWSDEMLVGLIKSVLPEKSR